MTYFEGFVVPVPEANKAAYASHANALAPLLREVGVWRQVEAWSSDVPDGKITDFRKSVDAKADEQVVFAWFEYPDRSARDAANQRMMDDDRMTDMSKDVPFDARRMIFGGFEAVVDKGSGQGRFTDGIVAPVVESKRDAYRDMARKNAEIFLEYGALHVVESLADDVPHGKLTDFHRAVKAEPGETVAFSFIEWPDKATRDAAWGKIVKDDRMQHGGGSVAGQRMFWGGFENVIDSGRQSIDQSQDHAIGT